MTIPKTFINRGAEVRPDPPTPTDYGLVVRPIASGLGGVGGWQTSQVAVDSLLAVQVAVVPLPNRVAISFRASCPVAGAEIFIGSSLAVSTITGTGLKDRETLDIDLDAAAEIWAIASADGQTLYITELAV